jgi:carboxylesterase type B
MANVNLSSLPTPDPRTSEDCLFLDVFVPTKIFNSTKSKSHIKRGTPENVECQFGKPCKGEPAGAPVLVWIYGGGYVAGDKTSSGNAAGLIASSLQNGSEGVVFMAMNYRLGLFVSLSPTIPPMPLTCCIGMAFWIRQYYCQCRTFGPAIST